MCSKIMDKEKLYQYIRGNASVDEKEDIIRWMEDSSENKREYQTLRKLHDMSLWHEEPDACATEVSIRCSNRMRRIGWEILKIAAVVIISFIAIQFYPDNSRDGFQTYYTPEGQRAELLLADGTHVWLNANSRLTYPVRFNEKNRSVVLEGEAFFSVTHNEKKPFVVRAQGYDIEVLGTEFNVIAYPQSDFFETSLLKGKVKVTTPLEKSIVLKPNRRIYAQAGKTYEGPISHWDHFLWKEGIICFNNETVEDIFVKLELYYDVKMEVRNKELLMHRFTGKFRILDGAEHLLKVLQLRHQFTYQKAADTNVIIINK